MKAFNYCISIMAVNLPVKIPWTYACLLLSSPFILRTRSALCRKRTRIQLQAFLYKNRKIRLSLELHAFYISWPTCLNKTSIINLPSIRRASKSDVSHYKKKSTTQTKISLCDIIISQPHRPRHHCVI